MKCTHPVAVTGLSKKVRCGKCIGCKVTKINEWKIRILDEMSDHEKAVFLTLTYDNENLPPGKSLSKSDLQKYIKRLRKDLSKDNRKIRHFSAGEYGDPASMERGQIEGDRPHYHLIIFGVSPDEEEILQKNWKKGFIFTGTVTEQSAAYVAGYIYKKYSPDYSKEEYGERQPPFQVQSQAIGKLQMERTIHQIKDMGYITRRGIKYAVPRYYRDMANLSKEKAEKQAEKLYQEEVEKLRQNGLEYTDKEAVIGRLKQNRQRELNRLAEDRIKEDRKGKRR